MDVRAGQIYMGCKPGHEHIRLRIIQVAGRQVQTVHLDGRYRRWTKIDYFHQSRLTSQGRPWRGGYALLIDRK
jgi:hypothetical protein